MKKVKECIKKRRVKQRRQLRWQKDGAYENLYARLETKKVKRNCTDWLGRETSREMCATRESFKG